MVQDARIPFVANLLLVVAASSATAEVAELRIANRVYSVGRKEELIASSVTVVVDGAVYDRLESPPQTIVCDPARSRVAVLDRERKVKVELSTSVLERFSGQFRRWAATSSDSVLAAAAAGEPSVAVQEDDLQATFTLDGMVYQVTGVEAPSRPAAELYGQFANSAVLVQTLLRPGGAPPFLRLALNRKLADQGWLPRRVELDLAARRTPNGRAPAVQLRSEHDLDPGLADSDRRLVREAHAQMADFESVDAEEYAGRKLPVGVDP